jgi:hypothetical protein
VILPFSWDREDVRVERKEQSKTGYMAAFCTAFRYFRDWVLCWHINRFYDTRINKRTNFQRASGLRGPCWGGPRLLLCLFPQEILPQQPTTGSPVVSLYFLCPHGLMALHDGAWDDAAVAGAVTTFDAPGLPTRRLGWLDDALNRRRCSASRTVPADEGGGR